MSFLKRIFTQAKPQEKTNKVEQQSMYELGGQAEKTEKISDKRPAETDMPKPQSQIKEKPSMFTKMKVKTKEQKKPQYQPVVVPQNPTSYASTYAASYTSPETTYSAPLPIVISEPTKDPTSPATKQQSDSTMAQEQSYTPLVEEKQQLPIPKTKPQTTPVVVAPIVVPELIQKKSQKDQPNSQIKENKKQIMSPTKIQQKLSSASANQAPSQTPPKKDPIAQIQLQILSSKKELLDEIRSQKSIKAQIIEMSQQLQRLHGNQAESLRLQNQAIQKQQFLLADNLQSKLTQINAKIGDTENLLNQLQSSFEKSQKSIIQFYGHQSTKRKSQLQRLRSVKDEANHQLLTFQKSEQERIENQKGKAERQRKKLKMLQNELKFNKQKLEQCQNQYNQDINNQIVRLKQQKQQLEDKKHNITEQIYQLTKKLELKKLQLSQINQSIIKADDNIQSIKKSFENQLRKIQGRRQKLNEMGEQLKEQSRIVDSQDRLVNDMTKNYESQWELKQSGLKFIDLQTETLESEGSMYQSRMDLRKSTFIEFMEKSQRLKQYELETKKTKQLIKQLQFKKSSVASDLVALETKKKELRQRIPVLQAQKTAMVSSKNFKGAASKTTQLKDANVILQELTSKIQASYVEQNLIDEELKSVSQNNPDGKDEQQALRNDLALSQYRFQCLKLQDLKNQMKTLLKCKLPEAQNQLSFISQEIKLLEEEVEYLKKQYGLEDVVGEPKHVEEELSKEIVSDQQEEEPKDSPSDDVLEQKEQYAVLAEEQEVGYAPL